jgi:site-specific recombinase XerD
MTTIRAFIVKSAKKGNQSRIRFRLTDGRNVKIFHKSEQYVSQELWDNDKEQCIKFKDKAKSALYERECKQVDDFVTTRKKLLNQIYDGFENKDNLTSAIFEDKIDRYLHPEKYETYDFFGSLDIYIRTAKISTGTLKQFKVLRVYLKRFEAFTDEMMRIEYKSKHRGAIDKYQHFRLKLDTFKKDVIEDFSDFLRDEHILFKEYPDIYKRMGVDSEPKERGYNTIVKTLRKLRTFIKWCVNSGLTSNYPFQSNDNNETKFRIEPELYGKPISMTLDELKRLYQYDFGEQTNLAIQRDIFVFQSMVGCRVSDLLRFTQSSVDLNNGEYPDGVLLYVALKTARHRATSLSIPLNKTAMEILNKYKDDGRTELLPYICEQKYNVAIKKMLEMAGIDRLVSVRDSIEQKDVNVPLCSVGSSHLARRNFYNNLYDAGVKDSVICSMSGHSLKIEGSSKRYHDVKAQLKIDAVRQLELSDEWSNECKDTSLIVEQLRSLSPEQLQAVLRVMTAK